MKEKYPVPPHLIKELEEKAADIQRALNMTLSVSDRWKWSALETYNNYLLTICTPSSLSSCGGVSETTDAEIAIEAGASAECQEATYTDAHRITYTHGFTDGAKWMRSRSGLVAGWVSVKDRLPGVDQWCLIVIIGMTLPLIACYKGNGNWLGTDPDFWTAKEDVGAWMPLPA